MAGLPLNILLVERDDGFRAALLDRLSLQADRITACRSFAEATGALSAIADPAEAPHAILSFADPAAGDDVSFYLAATRRFPGVRWIVIAPPRPHPSSNSISSAPSATCSPTA
jgi:hypothetical protein